MEVTLCHWISCFQSVEGTGAFTKLNGSTAQALTQLRIVTSQKKKLESSTTPQSEPQLWKRCVTSEVCNFRGYKSVFKCHETSKFILRGFVSIRIARGSNHGTKFCDCVYLCPLNSELPTNTTTETKIRLADAGWSLTCMTFVSSSMKISLMVKISLEGLTYKTGTLKLKSKNGNACSTRYHYSLSRIRICH